MSNSFMKDKIIASKRFETLFANSFPICEARLARIFNWRAISILRQHSMANSNYVHLEE